MKKGFALGQVLSNDAQTRLFGARDLEILQTGRAQIVRLELRIGPEAGWDQALIARYASIVDDLQRVGIEVIGLLSHQIVPRASQALWNANNLENGGTTDRDDPFREQYVAAAVQLAGALPTVRLWELWNEPNAWTQHPSPSLYTGSTFIYPSSYAALLGAAGHALGSRRPDSQIVLGGLFCHNIGGTLNADSSGASYLAALLQRLDTASLPIAGIGVHPYLDRGGRLDPGNAATAFGHLERALAASDGLANLPWYLTETGWQSPPLVPEAQAENLQTLYRHCEQAGRVAALCWFQINDNPAARLSFGLCHADYTAKPAFEVFAGL